VSLSNVPGMSLTPYIKEEANLTVTSRHAKLAWETSRLVGSPRYPLLRVLRRLDLLPMLRLMGRGDMC
jgi:hypothetical protein